MATETRPGFRLPWAAGGGDALDQPATDDAPLAGETEEVEEPDMTEAVETTDAASAPDLGDLPAPPELTVDHPARRATKFMADLSRAMQAAADHARTETMARFEVEAKGVVEAIHASATDEAAGLRRTADDDVAAIRDWSKAEIARIREATESKITARKTGLDGEMERHAATVQARVDQVAAVAAAFEAQMTAFFERLNAEEDPTRIATMAETMPDPPSLAEVAASVAVAPAAPAAPAPPQTFDFAAAEAEAATFSPDLENEDDLPAPDAGDLDGASVADASPSVDLGSGSSAGDQPATNRLVVSGLVSVANIANFKRSLARTPGIATIAVASGPEGDFVFTVGHTLGAALPTSVRALTGFDIQITGESDDAINVAAQDLDATD